MKRYLALLTAILLLFTLVGCAEQPQEEIREKILENITEAELIKLQALAISFEHPEGGEVSLSEVKDSQWNPVLEILAYDEVAKTYTVKVDPRLMYGFTYYVVTEEELTSIQTWEKEHEKKILYPLANRKDEQSRNDADFWYTVNESGMPIDKNGNEIPYAEDMRLVSNYDYDTDGNLRYHMEVAPGNVYKVRVCVYTYFEFRVGRELTFPLKDLNEQVLLNGK